MWKHRIEVKTFHGKNDLQTITFIKNKEKFPTLEFYARRYTAKSPTIFGGLQLKELYTETDTAKRKLQFVPAIQ